MDEDQRIEKRVPYRRVRHMDRRDFLRLGALLAVTTGAGVTLYRHIQKGKPNAKKILVTNNCVGCTGCASVCPTLAIEVVPGGIIADDETCISCGYCQMSCAVDGIRVLKATDGIL